MTESQDTVPDIQVGDVVRLKSDTEPYVRLAVSKVYFEPYLPTPHWRIGVIYFDGNLTIHKDHLPVSCVEKVG